MLKSVHRNVEEKTVAIKEPAEMNGVEWTLGKKLYGA